MFEVTTCKQQLTSNVSTPASQRTGKKAAKQAKSIIRTKKDLCVCHNSIRISYICMNTTLMRIIYFFICILFIIDCSAQQHSIGISPYSAFMSFKPRESSYPDKSSGEPQKYMSYGIKFRYNYMENFLGLSAGMQFQYIPLDMKYNSHHEFADANHGGAYSIDTYSTYIYQSTFFVTGLFAGFNVLLSADDDKNNRFMFSGIAQLNSIVGYKEFKDSVYITKHYYSYSLYPSYTESSSSTYSSAADVITLEPGNAPFLSLLTGLKYNHAFNNKFELDIELLFNFQSDYPLHLLQIEKIKPFVHFCAGINYRFSSNDQKR
ncbi:MAG TPA: hypothetical protein PK986_07010 [Spirochaetota bacterium]|nr:hypothetical protein [Spirochaetota bacterium]